MESRSPVVPGEQRLGMKGRAVFAGAGSKAAAERGANVEDRKGRARGQAMGIFWDWPLCSRTASPSTPRK